MVEQDGLLNALLSLALLFGMQTMTGMQSPPNETGGGDHRHVTELPDARRGMGAPPSRIDKDKDMADVLKKLQNLDPKPIAVLSAEEARQQPTPADAVLALLEERGRNTAPLPIGRTKDLAIEGPGGTLPIRLYVPEGTGPFPVVVYYHGGGWVIGTIDTYDASARALAKAAEAIVVSVEYRKAPEHKFPAAHEDAYAAYRWVLRNADGFGGDPSMVAVAGESAGGNLAASVCLMARARGELLPVHQALIYPVAGSDFDTPSYREHAQAQPLNKEGMVWFFDKYLKDPADAKNPWIDLVNAPNLSGLPPATIVTAEIDPLRSEGKRYAERLREAGVPVTYQNYGGVTHEFFGMGAVVNDAKKAVRLVANGMKGWFDDPEFIRGGDQGGHSAGSAQVEPLQE